MKHRYLAAALVVLAGCQSQTPPPDPTPSTTKVETTAPKLTTPAVAVPKADPNDIPERLYQLRSLKVVDIQAPGQKLHLWLMDDDGKEQEGMMFLTEKQVKDDQGMLFVFDKEDARSFWMRNTLLPLDIIYLDGKGKVVSIVEGKPKDETSLPSKGPAQFVVELKQGCAKKFGIGPGTILEIPKSVRI